MIPRLSHLEILCITRGYAGAFDETGSLYGVKPYNGTCSVIQGGTPP